MTTIKFLIRLGLCVQNKLNANFIALRALYSDVLFCLCCAFLSGSVS